MNRPISSNSPGSWNTYWAGAGTNAAYSGDGADHPATVAFWNSLFAAFANRPGGYSLLDIATGNGAVVARALASHTNSDVRVTCVDLSEIAVRNVCTRYPRIAGIVADAREIPLDDARFDLVTSQFGAEYAGLSAIHEATRLVAEKGTIAMLLHIKSGSVFRACSDSLAAVAALQRSQFVPLAQQFFAAGFAAVRGADRAAYEHAGRDLSPATRELERILARYGASVANGMLAKLYRDVGRIHERIQYYDPDEVRTWIAATEVELGAYADRMEAMTQAAIDEPTFERIRELLQHSGFDLQRADSLRSVGEDLPVAWAVIACRSA